MKEKVNNLVLFDKVREDSFFVFWKKRWRRRKNGGREEGRKKPRPRFAFLERKKNTHRKKNSFSLSPPLFFLKKPGHVRQAHPGGPQVQDDHAFDPLGPPPHQRLARARGDPAACRRGRDQADRRVAPPVHLHEGDQRVRE